MQMLAMQEQDCRDRACYNGNEEREFLPLDRQGTRSSLTKVKSEFREISRGRKIINEAE